MVAPCLIKRTNRQKELVKTIPAHQQKVQQKLSRGKFFPWGKYSPSMTNYTLPRDSPNQFRVKPTEQF
jgi:hypothetical protein